MTIEIALKNSEYSILISSLRFVIMTQRGQGHSRYVENTSTPSPVRSPPSSTLSSSGTVPGILSSSPACHLDLDFPATPSKPTNFKSTTNSNQHNGLHPSSSSLKKKESLGGMSVANSREKSLSSRVSGAIGYGLCLGMRLLQPLLVVLKFGKIQLPDDNIYTDICATFSLPFIGYALFKLFILYFFLV